MFHWREQDYTTVRAAVSQLVAITSEGEYPLDQTRIVLAGLHTGGLAALEMAVASPSEVIGLVAGSGWVPRGGRQATDSPWRQLENLRGCPALLLFGAEDKTEYPYALASMASLFERAGVKFIMGLQVAPSHDSNVALLSPESQVRQNFLDGCQPQASR